MRTAILIRCVSRLRFLIFAGFMDFSAFLNVRTKKNPCQNNFQGRDFGVYTAVDHKVIIISLAIVIFVGVIVIVFS